jgi:hypothetical protein
MNKKMLLGFSVFLLSFVVSAFSPMPAVQAPGVEVVKSVDVPKPGEPGLPSRTLVDANSSLKASEKRTISGDNYFKNVFERPFTSIEMVYLPDTDILTASLFTDTNYHYFSIQLAGLNKADNKLTATYGIEFDLTKGGSGDYLVTAMNPTKDWSTVDVRVYTDPNGDVGGTTPVRTDSNLSGKGDGYEKTLDNTNSAYARLDPKNPAVIQIAVSRVLLADPKEFLWGAWADNGLRNPQKMDYNDLFTVAEAGSAIKSDPNYPVKALSAVDNTCHVPYGFKTTQNLPGMCMTAAPEKIPQPVPAPAPEFPEGPGSPQ